jgi:hypothetical protein
MVPRPVAVKAEIEKCGTENTDYRNLRVVRSWEGLIFQRLIKPLLHIPAYGVGEAPLCNAWHNACISQRLHMRMARQPTVLHSQREEGEPMR